jgi:hypothetical protein
MERDRISGLQLFSIFSIVLSVVLFLEFLAILIMSILLDGLVYVLEYLQVVNSEQSGFNFTMRMLQAYCLSVFFSCIGTCIASLAILFRQAWGRIVAILFLTINLGLSIILTVFVVDQWSMGNLVVNIRDWAICLFIPPILVFPISLWGFWLILRSKSNDYFHLTA